MRADGIISKEQDLDMCPLLKHSLVLRTRVTVFIIKPIFVTVNSRMQVPPHNLKQKIPS